MKFEYCCQMMKELMEEYADVNIEEGIISFDGWEFNYCPFCGEKIEIETKVKK